MQQLYLSTKTEKDSIGVTNNLLHTINGNTYILGPKDFNNQITTKQHDFMTYIFKGLQVMVNKLNNTVIQEQYFHDLPLQSKIDYMKENCNFFEVKIEDVIPFLERTPTGTRHISRRDALIKIQQIDNLSNIIKLYTIKKNGNKGELQSITLFPTVSLKYEEIDRKLISITSFDLYINPDAMPFILEVFDKTKGFGNGYIEHILSLKSVHSKNLYYYISRYANLVTSNTGYTVNLDNVTKYLGINKNDRPYKDLQDIIKKFNKDLTKIYNNCKLVITPTKKGKGGTVIQINLKLVSTNTIPYSNTKHSEKSNNSDIWF